MEKENFIDEDLYKRLEYGMKTGIELINTVCENVILLAKNLDEALCERDKEIEELKKLIRGFENDERVYKNEIKIYQNNEIQYDNVINMLHEKLKESEKELLDKTKEIEGLKKEGNYNKYCLKYAPWELDNGNIYSNPFCSNSDYKSTTDLKYAIPNESNKKIESNEDESENENYNVFDKLFKYVSELDSIPKGVKTEKTDRVSYSPKVKINQIPNDHPLYKGFAELLNRTFGQEYFTFEELERTVNDYYDNVYKSEEKE